MVQSVPQPQILIVAEDDAIGELLSTILASEGYGTRVAASPSEALALHAMQPAALILTDLFTRRGRDLPPSVHDLRRQVAPCPVGVLTAWLVTVEEIEEEGFAFLVRQPFDLDYLLLSVAASLAAPLTLGQERRVAVVEQYFAALSAGAWDALLALCTEEVTYVLPPPAPFATTLHGKAAFRAYTQDTFRHFPAVRFSDIRVYGCPRGVVARYDGSWQAPGGQELQQKGAVVFTFVGELIAQIGSLVDADRLRTALQGALRQAVR